MRTSDYGYAHVWELQHLRASPDCQPDITKENCPTTTATMVGGSGGGGYGGGEKSAAGEQRLHYDQRLGTLTACRNKDHMYESPRPGSLANQQHLEAADIVLGHDAIPYYHEFDSELQDMTTFAPPPACMADAHHECIHMALSDKKL